jgi:hypothetical protein
MSNSKHKAIVVTRTYKPSPGACVRALELLLIKAALGSRPERPERIQNAPARLSIPE